MCIFQTDRLIVRYLQDDDFEAFHALCSDPEIVEYMGDGKPLTAEQTRQWIQISQNNYQNHDYGCFAILSRQNGEMIGFGGLIYPPGSTQVEIIYAFKEAYWGKGLASEFAYKMIETGFQRWKLPRIEASIDPNNAASLRVVQKLGMTHVRSDLDENQLPTEFYAIDNP